MQSQVETPEDVVGLLIEELLPMGVKSDGEVPPAMSGAAAIAGTACKNAKTADRDSAAILLIKNFLITLSLQKKILRRFAPQKDRKKEVCLQPAEKGPTTEKSPSLSADRLVFG